MTVPFLSLLLQCCGYRCVLPCLASSCFPETGFPVCLEQCAGSAILPISRSAVLGVKRVTMLSCHHNPLVIFSPTRESVPCECCLQPSCSTVPQSLALSALPLGTSAKVALSLSTVSSRFIHMNQPPYLPFFPFSELVSGCGPPVLVFLVWSSLPSPLFPLLPFCFFPPEHPLISLYSISFIRSSTCGPLGCFHLLLL